jgi:membrane fusion protein (multidrug efflux system)
MTAQLAVARTSLAAAESGTLAAREQLASNQSLTEGISVEQHPNVLRAAARVREAHLALDRAELLAPVDGYVARRTVQLGQRVQAGTPLLSVIPLDDVWVDANFKEGQLRNLRIGQPVELVADVYGRKVEYHGTIEGLGAGTGAAFALLPAQNATGNWIKVVQRVPVRIALDAKEVVTHPLRIGLSMDVRVDVSKTDGRMLADASEHPARARTAVFDDGGRAADAEVARIIAANIGRASKGQTTQPHSAAQSAKPEAFVQASASALRR